LLEIYIFAVDIQICKNVKEICWIESSGCFPLAVCGKRHDMSHRVQPTAEIITICHASNVIPSKSIQRPLSGFGQNWLHGPYKILAMLSPCQILMAQWLLNIRARSLPLPLKICRIAQMLLIYEVIRSGRQPWAVATRT
jgi:hypothetical protein